MGTSFQDRTIVVTGGAMGIGAGCVRVFHREGGRVVVLDVDEEAGQALCRELGERALFVACDVSQAEQVERAMERTAAAFGGVDVLVNNAGVMHYANVTGTSEEAWDRVLGVNIKGAFLCARHAIPYMLERERGVVVNMSSVQAFVAQENVAAYVTSKAALVGLTRSIAVDYAPHVRSVAICPGGVDTPQNRKNFSLSPDPEAVRQETVDLHLVERMAEPDEIGELAAFVASDRGSFVNGQPIRIDGGLGVKIGGSKKE